MRLIFGRRRIERLLEVAPGIVEPAQAAAHKSQTCTFSACLRVAITTAARRFARACSGGLGVGVSIQSVLEVRCPG